jgi:cold shock CspA family protein
MLRAIRKFVFRRDRGAGQGPQGLVEEDDSSDQANNSDDALQSAGQEFEEPSEPTIWGKLKWYNPNKRYGFVELSDGSGDAFLHATALANINIGTLQPGVKLEFRLAPG